MSEHSRSLGTSPTGGPETAEPPRSFPASPEICKPIINAMSVDVEEHFQVSAFDGIIAKSDWAGMQSRVAANMDRILELFDQSNTKATFFTLGCVAERAPEIVRKIVDEGHEIASHGYQHTRVGAQTPAQFRADVTQTKQILEDISGCRVSGYRAASFSIGEDTLWAHEVLQESGYEYSSSIYPINHDHYGLPSAPRFPYRVSENGITEIPLATVLAAGKNWPCAGGGYFRLLPLTYSRWALKRVNTLEQMPAAFYFHPWEIDPDQPRVSGIPLITRFRHYVNLGRFEDRLRSLLEEFSWGRMDEVYGSVLSAD